MEPLPLGLGLCTQNVVARPACLVAWARCFKLAPQRAAARLASTSCHPSASSPKMNRELTGQWRWNHPLPWSGQEEKTSFWAVLSVVAVKGREDVASSGRNWGGASKSWKTYHGVMNWGSLTGYFHYWTYSVNKTDWASGTTYLMNSALKDTMKKI